MGRGKLNMELISNERSRMTTYHKRKKGLIKKVREFQILCDVDACVIIFGPKINNRPPVEFETWPANRSEIERIVNKYRSKGNQPKRIQDLSDFFLARKKKVDDEIAKLRKASMKAKFPVWDDRLNPLSIGQLRVLAGVIDNKLEDAKNRLLKLKAKQFLREDSNSNSVIKGGNYFNNNKPLPTLITSTFANALIQKNIELELLNQPLPAYYPSDQAIIPINVSPIDSPSSPIHSSMLMMMVNGEDHHQMSQIGSCCDSGKIPCNSLKSPFYYNNYDHGSEMTGNVMFNNISTRAHPTNFYGPTGQAMVPHMQAAPVNVMPNHVSSQIRIPQFSDFCEINEFEMNNKGFRHAA